MGPGQQKCFLMVMNLNMNYGRWNFLDILIQQLHIIILPLTDQSDNMNFVEKMQQYLQNAWLLGMRDAKDNE